VSGGRDIWMSRPASLSSRYRIGPARSYFQAQQQPARGLQVRRLGSTTRLAWQLPRRIFRRLQDAESTGRNSAEDFRDVLHLFREYLRDAEVARRRMRRHTDSDQPPPPYDPAAVFSNDFGRAAGPALRQMDFSQIQQNIFAIIEALFAVSSRVGARSRRPSPLAATVKSPIRPPRKSN
jgi:hypothetical protein